MMEKAKIKQGRAVENKKEARGVGERGSGRRGGTAEKGGLFDPCSLF
jgi:hypothetical protein